MNTKFLFIAIFIAVILIPVNAVDGEDALYALDWSYNNNAVYEAFSGGGTAIENSSLAFDNSPASLASKKFGFSTPYVSATLFNTDSVISFLYNETWAENIGVGITPLYEFTSGVEGRFKYAGIDLRIRKALYACGKTEENVGRDSAIMSLTSFRAGLAGGFKIYWAWNFSLSAGLYTGLELETRSKVYNTGYIADIRESDLLETFMKNDMEYTSYYKIPLSAGIILNVPGGIALGVRGYNNSLLSSDSFTAKGTEEYKEKVKDFGDGAFSSLEFGGSWNVDAGLSWSSLRLFKRDHYITFFADVVDIISAFNGGEITDHVRAGAEYQYKSAYIRGSWHMGGFSVGLGADIFLVHFDVAYSRFESKPDKLSLTAKLGL